MSRYAFVSTDVLDIAYLEWNPQGARSAVLLHGWPDSPHTWKDLAESLADAGYRVLAPALRDSPRPASAMRLLRAAGNWRLWLAICWHSSTAWHCNVPCWSAMTGGLARWLVPADCARA
ncbi:hypothetical protein PA6761_06000 [Pseudomonas aeruginosa]